MIPANDIDLRRKGEGDGGDVTSGMLSEVGRGGTKYVKSECTEKGCKDDGE